MSKPVDPVRMTGTVRGISITIIGEPPKVHPREYETMDLNQKTIWVEHPTNRCDLYRDEMFLFQHSHGTEWVWYTSKLKGRPVTCIDNRSEYELPSRMEEVMVLHVLNDMYQSEHDLKHALHTLLTYTMRILRTFQSLPDIVQRIQPEYGTIRKTVQHHIDTIQAMRSTKGWTVETVKTLHHECMNLYHHLVNLCAMAVDVHIMNLLDRYHEKKPVFIFVHGANHVRRLFQWLNVTPLVKRSMQKTPPRRPVTPSKKKRETTPRHARREKTPVPRRARAQTPPPSRTLSRMPPSRPPVAPLVVRPPPPPPVSTPVAVMTKPVAPALVAKKPRKPSPAPFRGGTKRRWTKDELIYEAVTRGLDPRGMNIPQICRLIGINVHGYKITPESRESILNTPHK